MNRALEVQQIDDDTRLGDTGPVSPDEELAAWLRRSLAANGFGAPEAAVEPAPQSRGNGTNM